MLTGYLPAQQQRVPSWEDYPDRPAGDLYCRVPQDSARKRPRRPQHAVRRPARQSAPRRSQMCESDESYVPLNDGYNWKGDPNATLSGQPVPQPPPRHRRRRATTPAPAPLPIAAAEYDPATGTYIGPDGHVYTQSDLATLGGKERTWQTMLLPPKDKRCHSRTRRRCDRRRRRPGRPTISVWPDDWSMAGTGDRAGADRPGRAGSGCARTERIKRKSSGRFSCRPVAKAR